MTAPDIDPGYDAEFEYLDDDEYDLPFAETATWEGAPQVGDLPVALDRMAELLDVDGNTPYTWSHRKALPRHDGINGRSRYWWASKIVRWYDSRNTIGGRPRMAVA